MARPRPARRQSRRTSSDEGLPVDGFTMIDGSGPRPRQPSDVSALLTSVLDRAGPHSDLTNDLSIAGETGTLDRRFANTVVAGKVRAKTGTLTGVVGLAGFAQATDGTEITFALLLNGDQSDSGVRDLDVASDDPHRVSRCVRARGPRPAASCRGMSPALPMFPLGTVLFPSLVLPLHVFEPRYRALARDCLDGDRRFGVVLIERGSEVGGGDVRFGVGTVAQIVEAAELPDGRFALGTVGVARIRIVQWLDDDPYPRAEVEEWAEPSPTPDLDAMHRDNVAVLRRVLAMKAELREMAVPATIELSPDPVLAGYQAAAVAPLGPADQQALLEAATPEARARHLGTLLAEQEELLSFRLG